MGELFLHLLNATIRVAWLVPVVLLVRLCLPRMPKFIRPLLWGIVALRLVLPFSIESAISLLPSSQTIPDEIVYATIPSLNTGIGAVDTVINPVIGQVLAPQAGDSVNPIQILLEVGGYVWAVGLGSMLVYALVSYLLVRRSVREAVLLEGNCYVCDHIATPFILGIFRPRIYLPSLMNEQDSEYVLAHERAHLSRRDHWWKPIGFILLAVHWFNPLLWLSYILLCRDIELACDEKVITAYGEEQKKPYADALINCSMPRKRIAACPLAFGENSVKGRIKSVLHYKKPAFWLMIVAIVACVTVAVTFLTDPKDKWQSENYGIVGTVSGVDCENVLFHYRFGSINHQDPHITVQLKNDTDDILCYGEQFTLYRGDEPCPTLQDPKWNAILKTLAPDAERSLTYSLADYDLSENGSYRLETEVYFQSDPDKKYTAYVKFGIDRIYSFVGWQYVGEGVVYGNDKAPDAKYTDSTVPNVYIADDRVYLLIAENGKWKEIGQLTQDSLDRTRFDHALSEDWWDAGYSAKLLRENNKHTVSYINADAKESYYLLEQQNGEIYLTIGSLSKIDWIFRLTPVTTTHVIWRPTGPCYPPTGPPTSPPYTPGTSPQNEFEIQTQPLGGYQNIDFSCVDYEEKDGRLLMTVRWKNDTDQTILFGPEFTVQQNGKEIFPPEGYGWDTVLYSVAPGGTFLEVLDISACVEKGECQLTKYFRFSPITENSAQIPAALLFTLSETRKTTAIAQTTTGAQTTTASAGSFPTTTVDSTGTTVVPSPTPAFKGTVLEVYDDAVLIRVDKVEAGPHLDGTVWASKEFHWSPHRGEVIEWKAGMTINVLYTGEIIKSDPPRLKAVLRYCNCSQL